MGRMAEELEDLCSAIHEGNLQEVTALIDSYEQSASSGLLGGYSSLRLAVELNQVDIAKLLLYKGYPVNASETFPYSVFYFAVANGSSEMVELFLKKGADVNSKPKAEKSVTPLFRAIKRRRLPIVELLLKYGADVNAEDNKGMTPLHFCSYYIYIGKGEAVLLEIAKLLLNKGAKINARAHNGCTPLHLAILSELYSLVDLFLRCNADTNLADSDGKTALHFAVQDGCREIASSLLAKGADVHAKTIDGKTALHVAVMAWHGNHEELVELLLENGAIVNCVDVYGDSLFHYLAKSWRHKFKEIGTLLLKWGADVNCRAEIGRTALHIAAEKGHAEFAEFLLENGAHVNCQDRNGESPLHLAYDAKTTDILIEFGAIVDCRSHDGRTPLHAVSSVDRLSAVASLLEYGADINIKCDRRLTPLDWTHNPVYDWSLRNVDVQRRHSEFGLADARDVLLRHQANMEGLGLHVEESRFLARYEGRLEQFRKSCQEEMLLLRSEFIDDTSVSYYDLLRKDVRFLAKYVVNENVVQAAELEEYKRKFPTYASMIKRQFRRGRARNDLLKAANQVLKQLIYLPDYCKEKIMDYLCDDDLAVLINV